MSKTTNSQRRSALTTFEDFVRRADEDRELAEREASMRPSQELALMLVDIRKHLSLTQREFAERIGKTQAYVSKLESGTANPSIRTLNDVLRAAGIVLNLSATVVMGPKAERKVFELSKGKMHDHLNEGEMFHLQTVVEGTARAMVRSRTEQVPLDEENVVGEIVATYRAGSRGRRSSRIDFKVGGA